MANRTGQVHGAEEAGLRVAVFDLDGTLVETDAANTAAYLDALEGVGLRGMAAVRGRLTLAGVRRLAKGISDGELEEIRRRKAEAYVWHLARTHLAGAWGGCGMCWRGATSLRRWCC